ncbi:MAG TPA: cell division protein BolA [Gammaproteobacteria bacterium]|nr:cell division protein BolA [Gammaproteobacteria bacterium]
MNKPEIAPIDHADITQRIVEQLPGAEVDVEGEDCNATVTVISDRFEGLASVKRQQMVLAGFADVLASGRLHALSVKPYTLAEWNERHTNLVQISL